MRPIEIMLVVMLLVILGSYIAPANRRPRWLLFLPSLTLLIAIVQLVIEQYRWQMVPAYFLTVVFFLTSLMLIRRQPAATPAPVRRRRRTTRIVGVAVIFLLWVVAAALPALIPIPQLPEPTGPYAIGTHSFELVDPTRPETFSSEPNRHRDLVVQVWYPAKKVPGDKPTAYWPDARIIGTLMAKAAGLPTFFFDHFALVESHSYLDAPLAQAQKTYPVLIFSHGYGLLVTQNTAQMEELASQGYVVFSIAHPYESMATVYPDGRVIPWSEAQFQRTQSSVDLTALDAVVDQYKQATDIQTSEALVQRYQALVSASGASMKIWTDDTVFVMNEIELINRGALPSLLSGYLNLDQIGLFGHSYGGGTAVKTCIRDSRCKAAASLDGGLEWGDSIAQPLMIMYNATTPTNRAGETMNDVICNREHQQYYRLWVKDTLHNNYTDFSIFKLGGVGSIDGYRMEAILNHYLVTFFDKHLKGIDSPALNGPDPLYPEVAFQVRYALPYESK